MERRPTWRTSSTASGAYLSRLGCRDSSGPQPRSLWNDLRTLPEPWRIGERCQSAPRFGVNASVRTRMKFRGEPMKTPSRKSMSTDIAAWLALAADEKAQSIVQLAPPKIETVVDVGAGTGAVLSALDRRGFARSYWACEPSRELSNQIPEISRLAGIEAVPFADAFSGRKFDLAILSHVLEHVLSPAALLSDVLARASYVIVELPIEASLLTRLRTRGIDRAQGHPAGHVHFFSESDARRLISLAGGQLLGERAYFPFAPYRHQAQRVQQQLVLATASRFEWLARRHYEHFAMLCTVRRLESWDHHYPRPE